MRKPASKYGWHSKSRKTAYKRAELRRKGLITPLELVPLSEFMAKCDLP